jgi:hypothetical protein
MIANKVFRNSDLSNDVYDLNNPSIYPDAVRNYTFSTNRYFNKIMDDSAVITAGSQGTFLSKNVKSLMADCPNLIEEINKKQRYSEDDV